MGNPAHPDYPDMAIVVADASNLKRNLLLFSQVRDLGIPTVLALNMIDVAENEGYVINSSETGSGKPSLDENLFSKVF